MDGHGNGKAHGHSVDPTNQELSQLNKIAADGEKLVAKMDSTHRGFVTPDELFKATKDTHLSAAERKTAGELYKLQEELRYERLGILPSLEMPPPGGPGAGPGDLPGRPHSAASEAGRAAGEAVRQAGGATPGDGARVGDGAGEAGRAAAELGRGLLEGVKQGMQDGRRGGADQPQTQSKATDSQAAQTVGEAAGTALGLVGGLAVAGGAMAAVAGIERNRIYQADVKNFHRDVTDAITGKDIKRLSGEVVAKDIMAKYGDHGKLDVAHTDKALAALHAKSSLTSIERDEMNVLTAVKRTQTGSLLAAALAAAASHVLGADAIKSPNTLDLAAVTKVAKATADRELHNPAVVEATHALKPQARGHAGPAQEQHARADKGRAPAVDTYAPPRPTY